MSAYAGMFLMEAICSTAMSHEDGCACRTCKAAHGDAQAIAELMSEVAEELARREAKA